MQVFYHVRDQVAFDQRATKKTIVETAGIKRQWFHLVVTEQTEMMGRDSHLNPARGPL